MLVLLGLLVLGAGCARTTGTSSASAPPPASDPDEEGWTPLFNGEDLEGWSVKITGHPFEENVARTFRVEDGLLKVRYDGYDQFDGQFGHLFYRERLSHYKIRAEYRFVGEQVAGGEGWAVRNSGIMVHAQSPQSMTRDQDFPTSIEVQLLGGTGEGERPTANLCTPGTHVVMEGQLVTQHCTSSRSDTYHGDQWVRAEAIVLGDSLITHVVEGDTVLQYTRPQRSDASAPEQPGPLLREGYIALQSESHPIDIRAVELLKLAGCTDPEARNYRSYYVASADSTCIY